MLKLFGKQYINYDELIDVINESWRVYQHCSLECLKMAKNDKDEESYQLERANDFQQRSIAVEELEAKIKLRFGRG